MGTGSLPGVKRPGRDADPSPLLVPWSWKGRAIPLLPLWAVRPVQSLSACTRVTFTFTYWSFFSASLNNALTTRCKDILAEISQPQSTLVLQYKVMTSCVTHPLMHTSLRLCSIVKVSRSCFVFFLTDLWVCKYGLLELKARRNWKCNTTFLPFHNILHARHTSAFSVKMKPIPSKDPNQAITKPSVSKYIVNKSKFSFANGICLFRGD